MKSVTISIVSPFDCHEVMGPDAMIFIFWMLSFKPAFSHSSFTFLRRLFSSSLSAFRGLSSAYHCCLSHQGSPSWTVKKTECQKMDAFKLWCWRRLFRVPWTARRSNQSILKEINPEYSLERLMLKLKLQYIGHLIWRANSLEKTLMLGKTGGRRRKGQQRMRWTQWTWVWASLGRWWTGKPGVLQSIGSQSQTWLSNNNICISEVIDISPGSLDSTLWFIQQPGIWYDILCTEVKKAGWQYTALTHSFPDLEPVRCSMSGSNCRFLTFIQDSQEASQVVWYSCLLKNFPQFVVIHPVHPVKGFNIVNESDVFLELSCLFDDPTDTGNLISGSSAFSKFSLNIWKFMVHVLLKPGLEIFKHYFASMWDECNCVVVWTFFGIAFLWDWNDNWHSPVLWPLLRFPNLLAYWVQHFHSVIF